MDGRDVEGPSQGIGRGNGTIELQIKVLRRKTADIHGDVREEGVRQDLSFLQKGAVEQGFEDAARAAGGAGDIDLPAGTLPFRIGITHIGEYGSAPGIQDDGAQIANAGGAQFARPPVRHRLCLLLQ